MQQNTTEDIVLAMDSSGREARDVLTEILRNGARQMLATAIENEVDEYIATYAHQLDDNGQRLVVRNGHMPPRSILTGLGQIEVTRPRVNDKRVDTDGQRCRFTSSILPPYLRRSKAIDELIPWLYLKGVSTGGFAEALQALVGSQAAGLSATTITRLMTAWQDEHKRWRRRSLEGRQYVQFVADGTQFNIRLEEDR